MAINKQAAKPHCFEGFSPIMWLIFLEGLPTRVFRLDPTALDSTHGDEFGRNALQDRAGVP
jgi:hypothetical protein